MITFWLPFDNTLIFLNYYLNNKDYKFYITDETKKITEHTFLDNSILWENKEIEYFYKNVDRNNNINSSATMCILLTFVYKYILIYLISHNQI